MVRLLTESWFNDFNTLDKWKQNTVRDALVKNGIDIENEDFEEVHFRSNHDPELKKFLNSGVLVFKFPDSINGRTQLAVDIGGKFVLDAYLPQLGYRDASECAMRDLLNTAVEIYGIIPSRQKELSDLRQQRKDAKAGSVDRYDNKKGIIGGDSKYRDRNFGSWKYGQYDKSGYKINPDKYKDMLANMGFERLMPILKDAKDIYVELANYIYDIDFSADRKNHFYNGYEHLMNQLVSKFGELDRQYKSYQNSVSTGEWGTDYYKEQTIDTLKDLQQLIRDAKKYLQNP